MMYKWVTLAVLFALGQACKEGWEEFNDHCYFISGNKETWHSALGLCISEGGYLARINSRSENEYLKRRARSTEADIWIDGTDEGQEGTWVYGMKQTPIGFTDWNSGQPNNNGGNANCMGMYRTFDYHWDDDVCASKRLFICEMEQDNQGCSNNCGCCRN